MDIREFKQNIKDKSVAVVGVGVSNLPLIWFLLDCGAKVTACDKKTEAELGAAGTELIEKGVQLKCGMDYLENLDFEMIFKTPGMRPDLPQLEKARKSGSVITSEMELFFALCPCKIFAVTGSDGKTTTTTLIYNILKEAGYTCHLGGNIGRPLIGDLEKIRPEDMAVLELSSFQLFTMKQSSNVAVITNLSPNHLDWHKDMEEYAAAKKNVFLFQNENDRLVVNYDNEITRELYIEKRGSGIYFSRVCDIPQGVKIQNSKIVMSENGITTEIMDTADIKLPGTHNIENYMAATAAVWGFARPEHIKKVAKTFGGVEHRIEFVREINGIEFYNDSIASSPSRTAAALHAFDQKLILIAGGYDKKIPFDSMGALVNEKVKELVLIGKTAEKIKKAVESAGSSTHITECQTFQNAVETAYSLAKEGDIVILSPACASFDLFDNFEQRGNLFKELVMNIKA